MEKELAQRLEQFHKDAAKTGEEIVFRTFPQKAGKLQVLELTDFLKTLNDPASPFHLSNALKTSDPTVYPPSESLRHDGPSGKKRKLEDSEVPSGQGQAGAGTSPRYPDHVKANDHMTNKIYNFVKKECEELADLTDQVRLWVTLTLPKIEDGDNFGVHVQEEVLGELQRAQESALAIRDLPRQDHLTRAKICSKLIKYPNIEDYALALRDHDEKQFYFARQHLYDIRNVYASITDMMQKNISKIRTPKSNNRAALY
ncbi:hypothetical protein CC1G_01791 [Coprinopsis cinerea okayama7|uniref:Proteasome activator PA28 C-terminal domain-containing protein n=1 Tax=Coprinopsis cinerea (strain Okayama-7 / 130 / ATCC MYA-4618 / FGSC 9003) TaxID=240176 RepID=A8N2D8_COPC7|nr:hypothetical protein CC1G_01791 [Coprinopsis cinerea okayama7\|eukprot:XP_001829111.2 hypothetical protein CC1G_01791 [Coprinopsis cinerea okayama7\